MAPWASRAQQRWGHSRKGLEALGGAAKVAEWDASTDFKSIPERKGYGKGLTRLIRRVRKKKRRK